MNSIPNEVFRYLLEDVGIDEAEIARRRVDEDLWPFVPIEQRYPLEGEEGIAQLEDLVRITEAADEMAVAFPALFNDAMKMFVRDVRHRAEEALRRARERLEEGTTE